MPVGRTPTRSSRRLRGEDPTESLLEVNEKNPVAPNHQNNHQSLQEDTEPIIEMANQENPLNQREGILPNIRVEIPLNQVIEVPGLPNQSGGVPEGPPEDIGAGRQQRPVHEGFYQLEALLRALNVAPQVPLPTYSRIDHESPNVFIAECEQYFVSSRTRNATRTRTAATGLRGNAEKWWSCYSSLNFDWEKFQELLLGHFNSTAVLSRLNAALFSKKQADREPVGVFLQQKYLLYQWIRGNDTERVMVATLIELIRPNLRVTIRPTNPQTFSVLMSRAMEAEIDFAEQAPFPRPSLNIRGKEDVPRNSGPSKPNTDGQYPPKCWHCSERYMHKDCPVLAQKIADRTNRPPENWRRAADAPGPVAYPPN